MKVEVTDISPVKKTLTVEVDAEAVKRTHDEVIRLYSRKARVPGFRPGKVPRTIVESRYAREVEEEVRDRLLARSYREATEERGLRPLGEPKVEEVTHEAGHPFRFRTTIEVLPEFELKNHRGVEVRRQAVTVGDADVDKALEELRESRSRLVSEEGRAAITGDFLVVDMHGRPDEGEPFQRERVLLELGASQNPPEFNERLLGVGPDESREFPVVYPAEYPAAQLAGKTVRYEIKIHEVKVREVPDLDDEFAKDVGLDDLATLRERVREDLTRHREHEAEQAVRQQVLDKVLLENPFPLPDVLVEHEIRDRLEDGVRSMMMQGLDPREADIDWKQLRERQEEPARKTVHARLVLDAVARDEKLDVDKTEIEERLRREAARMGEKVDVVRARLRKGHGLEALKTQMLREKSLDLLTRVANIQNEES